MADTRHKGIICYGTEIDRKRLAALAVAESKSSSETLVLMIRRRYADMFGDIDPDIVLNHQK